MKQQQILQAEMNKLEQELANAYSERVSHQAKVTDAATTTGNAAADTSLQQQAVVASNTLAMITRMITTREEMYTDRDAQMTALNAATPDNKQQPAGFVPPPNPA